MSAIMNVFRTVGDLWSLVVGLQITGKFFAKPQITVHYPRQEVEPSINNSYRGPIKLVENPKTPGKSKCTACGVCVNACPSNCITVVRASAPKITPEQEKAFKEAEARGEEVTKPTAPREPMVWINDFSLCSLCGLCVDSCPMKCIEFSHDLYSVGTDRKDFQHDLLAPFPKAMRPEGFKAKET